jgi:hypothetical protein
MKHFGIMVLTLTLALGCSRTEQAPPSEPTVPSPAVPIPAAPISAAPIVLDAPVEFTIVQRSTTSLPGSNGKFIVTIDDITKGQVMTTISKLDGPPIVGTQSLRQDDVVTFTVSNHVYKIKLKTLKNSLMGEDKATFQLLPATAEEGKAMPEGDGKAMSEAETIEALIVSLKQLDGATFIRNGKEHTPDETISHMRSKWKWKKSQINTAEDFIRIAASKSSITGKPYKIKLTDGTEVNTKTWFTEQLEVIRKNPR